MSPQAHAELHLKNKQANRNPNSRKRQTEGAQENTVGLPEESLPAETPFGVPEVPSGLRAPRHFLVDLNTG